MSVIYEPKGRAKEYALLACNLFDGCVHGCTYCYVPQSRHIDRDTFHASVKPRERILEQLRAEALKFTGTDKRVLLCFSCDPYPPDNQLDEFGKYCTWTTREAIKILRELDIPFEILTKGGMRAARDFDLYGPNDAFATTLTFLDNNSSMLFEPKAALSSSRMAAIRRAKDRGITTWISLEPVISLVQSLSFIERMSDCIDHFKIGKLNHQQSDIDWRAFGIRAIELCEKYGVSYTIKEDLARYLEGVDYHNTDLRKVKR